MRRAAWIVIAIIGCRGPGATEPDWEAGPGSEWVRAAAERSASPVQHVPGVIERAPVRSHGRSFDEAGALAALVPQQDDALREIAGDPEALDEWLAQERTVLEIEQMILLRDPELAARRKDVAVAFEGYGQVRFLADSLAPFRALTSSARPLSYATIEQLRSQLVDLRVELRTQAFVAAAVDRLASAREACARLSFLAQEERVTAGHVELVSSLEPVIRSKLTTGDVSQADLLFLEAELERLRGRLEELELERSIQVAALNGLLDRDPTARLGEISPEALAPPPTAGDLERRALEHHPDLRKARAEIALRDTATRLAEQMAAAPPRPLAPMGQAKITGAAVRSPAAEALLAEMRLRKEAAEGRLGAHQARIRAQVADSLARRARADRRRETLSEGVLPRQKTAWEGLKGAWGGGGVSYLEVHASARSLLEAELDLAGAERDARLAGAKWMRHAGVR